MQNVNQIKKYITAGNCTFTLYSSKIDKRYTYHITKDQYSSRRYFVSVLYGPENDNSKLYRFLGLFYADSMILKVNSIGQYNSPQAKMIEAFFQIVDGQRNWPKTCEFYPSCKCARCGRKLTTPESIKKGIGPNCLEALGWNMEV